MKQIETKLQNVLPGIFSSQRMQPGPALQKFLITRILEGALPNEILAKGKRLFLLVHLKLCMLGNMIFAH